MYEEWDSSLLFLTLFYTIGGKALQVFNQDFFCEQYWQENDHGNVYSGIPLFYKTQFLVCASFFS